MKNLSTQKLVDGGKNIYNSPPPSAGHIFSDGIYHCFSTCPLPPVTQETIPNDQRAENTNRTDFT